MDEFDLNFPLRKKLSLIEKRKLAFSLKRYITQEQRRKERYKKSALKKKQTLKELRLEYLEQCDERISDTHKKSDNIIEISSQSENDSYVILSETSVSHTFNSVTAICDYLLFSPMQPEWMLEIPEDLEENWMFAQVPKGVRCILRSENGITHLINVQLHDEKSKKTSSSSKDIDFDSIFPGGSYRRKKGNCLLDCLWSEKEKTIWILDILAWNGQIFNECSAEMRIWMLNSKYSELEGHCFDCEQIGQIKIKLVEFELFTKETKQKASQSEEAFDNSMLPFFLNCTNVDNSKNDKSLLFPVLCSPLFLFVHKSSAYDFGTTPFSLLFSSFSFIQLDSSNSPTANLMSGIKFDHKSSLSTSAPQTSSSLLAGFHLRQTSATSESSIYSASSLFQSAPMIHSEMSEMKTPLEMGYSHQETVPSPLAARFPLYIGILLLSSDCHLYTSDSPPICVGIIEQPSMEVELETNDDRMDIEEDLDTSCKQDSSSQLTQALYPINFSRNDTLLSPSTSQSSSAIKPSSKEGYRCVVVSYSSFSFSERKLINASLLGDLQLYPLSSPSESVFPLSPIFEVTSPFSLSKLQFIQQLTNPQCT